jgi:hypothetical protein
MKWCSASIDRVAGRLCAAIDLHLRSHGADHSGLLAPITEASALTVENLPTPEHAGPIKSLRRFAPARRHARSRAPAPAMAVFRHPGGSNQPPQTSTAISGCKPGMKSGL